MLYTSYFANLKKLPTFIVPVSICAKAPSWYTGLQYKKLAPKYGFFMEWKKTKDNAYYIQHFNQEVLVALEQHAVVANIYDSLHIPKNKDIALMCYEKPSDFCHRHLVAQWLNLGGFTVEEYRQ